MLRGGRWEARRLHQAAALGRAGCGNFLRRRGEVALVRIAPGPRCARDVEAAAPGGGVQLQNVVDVQDLFLGLLLRQAVQVEIDVAPRDARRHVRVVESQEHWVGRQCRVHGTSAHQQCARADGGPLSGGGGGRAAWRLPRRRRRGGAGEHRAACSQHVGPVEPLQLLHREYAPVVEELLARHDERVSGLEQRWRVRGANGVVRSDDHRLRRRRRAAAAPEEPCVPVGVEEQAAASGRRTGDSSCRRGAAAGRLLLPGWWRRRGGAR